MKPINPRVFKEYDIRGIVDRDFDPEWVETLGQACGTFFLNRGQNRAVVGHDCRHSSPGYQTSLVSGLMSTGVHVTVLNQVPTPLLYYAVKRLDLAAGVMITASHNPPEYNGFKIWSGPGTIFAEQIQEIRTIMESGTFATGSAVASELDIVPDYLDHLANHIGLERPIRLVVDGGNGTGGEICAELLSRAGVEVVPLFCRPDGNFPNHHPDPTVPENLVDLRRAVLEHGAMAGIGLDGDADRIGVLDENGDVLYGDRLLALYARKALAARPGGTVIADVKCSHLLFKDIAENGGKPEMWKTGHSLVKARMQETDAMLAGEMSGHMFFADRYFGFDDALYAALRLAELLGGRDAPPLSQALDSWPSTVSTPEIRIECPEERKVEIVGRAQALFTSTYPANMVSTLDGIRVNHSDGWGLLRASNTQPVLVMRFEAENPEGLERIRREFEGPLAEWLAEN
ncbi:MAG: phosphomannomutase/phosphoglucomutase [Deltaproteobacteria bacterium]|nr:phosphomannomutase/phosphoglucomutase [Deltaproteobacteria bacterium]